MGQDEMIMSKTLHTKVSAVNPLNRNHTGHALTLYSLKLTYSSVFRKSRFFRDL